MNFWVNLHFFFSTWNHLQEFFVKLSIHIDCWHLTKWGMVIMDNMDHTMSNVFYWLLLICVRHGKFHSWCPFWLYSRPDLQSLRLLLRRASARLSVRLDKNLAIKLTPLKNIVLCFIVFPISCFSIITEKVKYWSMYFLPNIQTAFRTNPANVWL